MAKVNRHECHESKATNHNVKKEQNITEKFFLNLEIYHVNKSLQLKFCIVRLH